MKITRIVERTKPDGSTSFVIQVKGGLLFGFRFVDASLTAISGQYGGDEYGTLEEAQKNLCWWDGTRCTDKVVVQNGVKLRHKKRPWL